MKKRVLQRLLDVAEFELAGCINKHARLLDAYHGQDKTIRELEECIAAQAEELTILRAGFHDGRRERNELNTKIGVLENRVKMLRAGLEDGQRERKQLRVEIEQLKKNREYLKWLLFDRGDDVRPETPRPQPAPLRKPRRLWRSILCKRECE